MSNSKFFILIIYFLNYIKIFLTNTCFVFKLVYLFIYFKNYLLSVPWCAISWTVPRVIVIAKCHCPVFIFVFVYLSLVDFSHLFEMEQCCPSFNWNKFIICI